MQGSHKPDAKWPFVILGVGRREGKAISRELAVTYMGRIAPIAKGVVIRQNTRTARMSLEAAV